MLDRDPVSLFEQASGPLWVPGDPWPQGSKTLMRGRMIEYFNLATKPRKDGTRLRHGGELKSWRTCVTLLATAHMHAHSLAIIDGPAWVGVEFFMAKKNLGLDMDKCLRAVLDSLSAVAYRDDSQVFRMRNLGQQVAGNRGPGIELEWGAL